MGTVKTDYAFDWDPAPTATFDGATAPVEGQVLVHTGTGTDVAICTSDNAVHVAGVYVEDFGVADTTSPDTLALTPWETGVGPLKISGTVTSGDLLKTATNGCGLTAASGNLHWQALQDGTDGDTIAVRRINAAAVA